jgi:cytoskeletal protein RodZ
MNRRKMLPPPPQELQGKTLRIDYVSPVARAQKTQQLFSFSRLIETLAPLAQVKPDIFDNINADGTVRWAHKLLDAPSETLNSEEDVAQSRNARAKQQQESAELVKGQALAATAKDAASAAATMPEGAEPAPTPGVDQAQAAQPAPVNL